MSLSLATTPEEFRDLALAAIDVVVHYYRNLSDMPVMPATTAAEVRHLLYEALPEEPGIPSEILRTIQSVIYPLCRHNGHPRFFGYVSSPGSAATAVGELLTAALNANVTSWRSAPAAAELEHLLVDWLKEMIGYDLQSGGLLVSGGSMANLAALAAARTYAEESLAPRLSPGKRPVLRIYISEEGHFSIKKAAHLLGIGTANVQWIRTDAALRVDVVEMERQVKADRESGLTPMCIVANGGTTSTGAFDSLEELADIAERYGLWLHVDAAYGGFAALAPSAKHMFSGIERADSVSLDPHKWLYASVGCGCLLYRDAHVAARTFAEEIDYTRPIGLQGDEAFAFWEFGPELSRPFRALPLWLQLKLYGVRNLSAAVESNIACARYFGKLVEDSADLELLAPVGLSVFCFRFRPADYTGDLDSLNERILIKLQRAGSSYLSNTRVRGQFGLRGCVLNYRTTTEDMERLLEDVRDAAGLVLASES
jgi:aromatic-L-amino-acid/L-tryptophan decarboxylase